VQANSTEFTLLEFMWAEYTCIQFAWAELPGLTSPELSSPAFSPGKLSCVVGRVQLASE